MVQELLQAQVKPSWLKIRPAHDTDFSGFKEILRTRGLRTVCEEANCPNMAECWHKAKTVTFMVLGDTCTRGCKFCAVKTAYKGQSLDSDEPRKLAETIREMKLTYAVVTSVDRDDLPDQGAGHFAACIREIKRQHPTTIVEVLIPDFRGDVSCLQVIADAKPDVISHNIETVKRLQEKVRDLRATYAQSLKVLENVKRIDPGIFTKSSIMLGLGENTEEVEEAMKDLRKVGCDILTLGQYLKPKTKHLKVEEYILPEQFQKYKAKADELGFLYTASGPFVRSSYRAGELFIQHIIKKRWEHSA
ncbi:MAG: lipoyl synthase [Nanoarchaeota archaeon]